jgi:hypothetical protein
LIISSSAKLTVVPSLLEAHDIIEMEEIERDLDFKTSNVF